MIRRFGTAVLLAGTVLAGEQPPPPGPGVRSEIVDGIRRTDAVLPGKLVSYALVRGADGRRQVVLLVKPRDTNPVTPTEADQKQQPEQEPEPDTPRLPPCPEPDADLQSRSTALYGLDFPDPADLVLLHDGLPHDTTAIDAADVDGDGVDELLVARPGELLTLDLGDSREPGGAMELQPALDSPLLKWSSLHPRSVRRSEAGGPSWIRLSSLGRLELYGPIDNGPWPRKAEIDLPLEGSVGDRGIGVKSPSPSYVGSNAGGTLIFATPPEAYGKTRLKTTLVRASLDGGSTVTECWARLPDPEDVLDRSFLMIDDEPVLLVTTKPADKLSLFGEKRLRLYALERDRSRLGMAPQFLTDTRMNMWQDGSPLILDVNGDDRDDLVIGYWKGLIDDRVVLDAYLRNDDGTFSPSPRTTAFDVKKGNRDFLEYGRDLTGDGVPDLLLHSDKKARLLLHRGLASTTGKRLVTDKPIKIPLDDVADMMHHRSVTMSSGGGFWTAFSFGGRPRLGDVDGDGRYEILVVRRGQVTGYGLFRIITVE